MPWKVSPSLMIEDMRQRSRLDSIALTREYPRRRIASERLSGRRDLLQTEVCVRSCLRACG
jgi:hypothetical protein